MLFNVTQQWQNDFGPATIWHFFFSDGFSHSESILMVRVDWPEPPMGC